MYALPGKNTYEFARYPRVVPPPVPIYPPPVKQEMPTRVQTKRARTESYTKTKTKRKPKQKRSAELAEGGFRYYGKSRGLSSRRRRVFKKRERYSMRRQVFLGTPTVIDTAMLPPIANMVFGTMGMLVDPMTIRNYLVGFVNHSFGRIQLPFIGIKGLLMNHNSCTMNYKFIYGTLESSNNGPINMTTYAATHPPQVNSYMGDPLYRGLWYRMKGYQRYKLPAGARLNFKVGISMGSMTLDEAYPNKYQSFYAHLLFWPELSTDASLITTTPVIAYPNVKNIAGWFQPAYTCFIAKTYSVRTDQTINTFTGLSAPIAEFEAKAEDIMSKATT